MLRWRRPERKAPSPAIPPSRPVSPRLLRVVLPLLAVVTTAFGLYQLFLAGLALRVHSYPYSLLYAGMGIGGLAISSSLWRAWKGR
jgi:hypothetical protein